VVTSRFPPLLDDALPRAGPAQIGHHCGSSQPARRQAQTIVFDSSPSGRVEGGGQGRAVIVREDEVEERGAAIGQREIYEITCGGRHLHRYKTPPIEGIPYEADRGRLQCEA